MSHSLILLRLLASGQPMTVPQMADLSGLTMPQVMCAMAVLRKNKSMRSLDLPYQITSDGLAWLGAREAKAMGRSAACKPPGRIGRPPLPEEVRVQREMARRKKLVADRRLKRQQERARIRAAEAEHAERIRIAELADETLAQARSSRSPLEMAWGGVHA